MALSFLFFGIPILQQYLTFQCRWHDQGHILNILHNFFARGDFYSYDFSTDQFNIHWSPIFYLIAPYVALTKSLGWLLFLYVVAISLGMGVFYAFCERQLSSRFLAIFLTLLLLVNPFLITANLADHFEILWLPLFFGYVWAVTSQKTWLAGLLFLLALTVKEDAWMYAVALSLILWGKAPARVLSGFLLAALLYWLVVVQMVYPWLYPARLNLFTQFWNYGASEKDVLLYLLTHPAITWDKVFFGTGFAVLASFALLPIFAGWRLVPTLFLLYLWVNATEESRAHLSFYYSLPILICFAVSLPAAVDNICWLKNKFFSSHSVLSTHSSKISILFLVIWSVLMFYDPWQWRRGETLEKIFSVEMHTKEFRQFRQMTTQHLAHASGHVLAPFVLAAYVPPQPLLVVTHLEKQRILSGDIFPQYILFDDRHDDLEFSAADRQKLKEIIFNRSDFKIVDQGPWWLLVKRD